MKHNLIAISYAKRTLEPDSRERARTVRHHVKIHGDVFNTCMQRLDAAFQKLV